MTTIRVFFYNLFHGHLVSSSFLAFLVMLLLLSGSVWMLIDGLNGLEEESKDAYKIWCSVTHHTDLTYEQWKALSSHNALPQ